MEGEKAEGSNPVTPTTVCDILSSMNEYQREVMDRFQRLSSEDLEVFNQYYAEVMQSIIKKQEEDALRPKPPNRSEISNGTN